MHAQFPCRVSHVLTACSHIEIFTRSRSCLTSEGSLQAHRDSLSPPFRGGLLFPPALATQLEHLTLGCRPGWKENVGKGRVNCKCFSITNCKVLFVSLLVCVNFVMYQAWWRFLSPPTRSHPTVEITFINFDDVCGTNPDCFSNYTQLF